MSFGATTLAMFGNLGGVDLIVIAALGLLLFGKRLPEVGKNLGQAIVGFKKGLKETGDEIKQGTEALNDESETKPSKSTAGVKASTVSQPKKMLRPASEEP